MYPVENCADGMMSSRGTVKWPRREGAMISELSDELDIQPGHRVLEITDGPAETGPYDRILVTDPVTRVRWEWAEQWIWCRYDRMAGTGGATHDSHAGRRVAALAGRDRRDAKARFRAGDLPRRPG